MDRSLPCSPCPHGSACCTWGAPLTAREAITLRATYDESCVEWDPDEKEWRTAVVRGSCVFLLGNRCSIHSHLAYPSVCAGFPWRADDSEVDICPELLTGKRPELDALFDAKTRRLRTI